MSKFSQIAKVSAVSVALILCSSAFAAVKQGKSQSAPETDEGLGLKDNSLVIQDLDAQPAADDPKQLSELLKRSIETARAAHAMDEEVAEPISDEL